MWEHIQSLYKGELDCKAVIAGLSANFCLVQGQVVAISDSTHLYLSPNIPPVCQPNDPEHSVSVRNQKTKWKPSNTI